MVSHAIDWFSRPFIHSQLAAPITFLYNTLFVYEKKLREKSNFRQSLIVGNLCKTNKTVKHCSYVASRSLAANVYHMRRMEWCFSAQFSSIIESYMLASGEKRTLPAPVFNSRYAIDLLHKLVDDILFYVVHLSLVFIVAFTFH